MDILKLLQESKEELYPDDLDFFEQELVIGDYDDTYKTECKNEIRLLRAEFCKLAAPPKEKAPAPVKKGAKASVIWRRCSQPPGHSAPGGGIDRFVNVPAPAGAE